MSSRQRQQGFTLVEMAIVLVIIGLLLGGILKGQELITAARVNSRLLNAVETSPVGVAAMLAGLPSLLWMLTTIFLTLR